MITEINESKILTKHISCEFKCKCYGRKCNSNQKQNSKKRRCECKKLNIWEIDYIWNPATCSCKNGKYLASTVGNSVITRYAKTILTNFNEKNAACKIQNFTCIFINYHCIIGSQQFLLLWNKISNKTKRFITISCDTWQVDNINLK